MALSVSILGSGSTGNAILLQNGSTAVLLDAGFSGRELERRLDTVQFDPHTLNAIVVSHEHSDHTLGVGVLGRRYQLPVYGNRKTLGRVKKRLRNVEQRAIAAPRRFQIGELIFTPFCVSHDALDPYGFVVSAGGKRVAVATDLGYVSKSARKRFEDAAMIIIEANYDDVMLWKGSYPESLKRRIFSIHGHLSNEAAARFLADVIVPTTKHVCLAHLSQDNNTPVLAYRTVSRILEESGHLPFGFDLHVATADEVLGPISIE